MATPLPWHKLYSPEQAAITAFTAFPMFQVLRNAAGEFHDNGYLTFEGETLTYAASWTLTRRLAHGLQLAGLSKGDRVGLCMPNHPAFAIAIFALWSIGAIPVGLSPLYPVSRLVDQADDAGLVMLITTDDPAALGKTIDVLNQSSCLKTVLVARCDTIDLERQARIAAYEVATAVRSMSSVLTNGDENCFVPVDFDLEHDLALMQYTGGTTGRPKAAMLSHANLSINLQQMLVWWPYLERGRERTVVVAPMSTIGGVNAVLTFATALGSELLISSRFDARMTNQQIEDRRATILVATQTVFVAMLRDAEINKVDLTSLRCVQSGAAPTAVDVRKHFERLSGTPLQSVYGMTELSPAAIYALPEFAAASPICGVPLPLTRVEIRRIDAPTIEADVGDVGEICVAGPQVMKGYWQNPVQTADAMIGEFFRTGDLGYRNSDGRFFVVGRLKDMIIAGGYNIYPALIEDLIRVHPAIREVSVFGVPDTYRGETVMACVSLVEGKALTLLELQNFLRERLSPVEIPKRLEVMDELPKTPALKISRQILQQLFSGD